MITNNISWSLGPTPKKSLDPIELFFPSHPSDPATPHTYATTAYIPFPIWIRNSNRKIPSNSRAIPHIPPKISRYSANIPFFAQPPRPVGPSPLCSARTEAEGLGREGSSIQHQLSISNLYPCSRWFCFPSCGLLRGFPFRSTIIPQHSTLNPPQFHRFHLTFLGTRIAPSPLPSLADAGESPHWNSPRNAVCLWRKKSFPHSFRFTI